MLICANLWTPLRSPRLRVNLFLPGSNGMSEKKKEKNLPRSFTEFLISFYLLLRDTPCPPWLYPSLPYAPWWFNLISSHYSKYAGKAASKLVTVTFFCGWLTTKAMKANGKEKIYPSLPYAPWWFNLISSHYSKYAGKAAGKVAVVCQYSTGRV